MYKLKFLYSTVTILIIILILIIVYIAFPKFLGSSNLLHIISAFLTALTIAISLLNYNLRKKEKSNNVFARLNKVFVKDSNIQAVIQFLNHKEHEEPTVNELELFLRFFEEVDIYINAGDIDPKVVKGLFYYYCNDLIHNPENRKLLDKMEFNLDEWQYLKEIDNRMQKINA